MFVVYTPPLHAAFGGSHNLSPIYWLVPLAFGLLIPIWATIRVFLLRRRTQRARVKDIKGLRMCKSPLFFERDKVSHFFQ